MVKKRERRIEDELSTSDGKIISFGAGLFKLQRFWFKHGWMGRRILHQLIYEH